MGRRYDPDTEIKTPPAIGELLWVQDRALRWIQAPIIKISPIPEIRSPWSDHEGVGELWMHAGFMIVVRLGRDRLETRFWEEQRLPVAERDRRPTLDRLRTFLADSPSK